MGWITKKFFNKNGSFLDKRSENHNSDNESIELSVHEKICFTSNSDQNLNVTYPLVHQQLCVPQFPINFSQNSSTSSFVYVPSSFRVNYSLISSNEYTCQILRQKDFEIEKLMEQNEAIKLELQNYRAKNAESEQFNRELQCHILSWINSMNKPFDEITANSFKKLINIKNENNLNEETNNKIMLETLKKDFKSELNCNLALNLAKNEIINKKLQNCKNKIAINHNAARTSTPLRNETLNLMQNFNKKNLSFINDLPFAEKFNLNLKFLKSILQKYEINIAALSRIIQSLIEKKNPNPDDLFTSFFDLETNNSETECNEDKTSLKNISAGSNINEINTDEVNKNLENNLAKICWQAREILLQFDLFQQQLLICIGSDSLKPLKKMQSLN